MMRAKVMSVDWHETNQDYLLVALAEVRQALVQHARISPDVPQAQPRVLRQVSAAMPAPPALETLCQAFGLSPFERQVLLLCAGMELDGSFAALCAAAQGDARWAYPTFSLVLAALPDAHWSALSPAGPLRYWRLIEFGPGEGLVQRMLRIDERILHYLAGVQHLDERLMGYVEPVRGGDELAPSHRALAARIARTIASSAKETGVAAAAVQLNGGDPAAQRAIAAAACAQLSLNLHALPVTVLPFDPREFDALIRLWRREAILGAAALFLDCLECEGNEPARESAIARLLEAVRGVVFVAGRERRRAAYRPVIAFDVKKPPAAEGRALWQEALGQAAAGLDEPLAALASQFSPGVPAIHAICAEVLVQPVSGKGKDGEAAAAAEGAAGLDEILWDACRRQVQPRLEHLAQRLEPAAVFNDLVLPEAQKQILSEIAMHVRNRFKVYETWGFGAGNARGLGISALFAGPSGTGKTMAAEALAARLKLDLYRIDLSQVVSKYIGETEKNLRRIFEAAEDGGAILFFDEADALFGKRSEVRDSHDRYANIEISYLLQRMELYQGGGVILATNMMEALDTAFLRRIRFVVRFPFPGPAERAEIWRRIFPPDTPKVGLDPEKLARLNVAGGNIRNMAVYAAFLAAEAGEPVRMPHLLRAAQAEYAKLERPLTEAEIGGWV